MGVRPPSESTAGGCQLRPLPLRVTGTGAVSPAGWGTAALVEAVSAGTPLAVETTRRAPGAPEIRVRRVPKPATPLPFLREARLRRTSPIAQFAVAASLEALGAERASALRQGELRLAVICYILNGCVNFSRRFYSEVLANPATASPLVFPETVFNAPSSHLSALLGSREPNYTLVGDSAQFLAAFELADLWLEEDEADAVLVVCSEEFDWLSAEAATLLDRRVTVAEGAAAVVLEKGESRVAVTPPVMTSARRSRAAAARLVREACRGVEGARLFDGLEATPTRATAPEAAAWADFAGPRVSVKATLGDGLGTSVGWQVVAATAHAGPALVLATGSNQQVLAARLG